MRVSKLRAILASVQEMHGDCKVRLRYPPRDQSPVASVEVHKEGARVFEASTLNESDTDTEWHRECQIFLR
jgi:hypothetical protein